MTLIERRFRERIVVVGVVLPWTSLDAVERGLDELELLVDTAGADVLARVVQRRDAPDPATYIGKGKAAELHGQAEEVDADTVVFDDELSPAQQRNLEKILGRTAIDRTAVILDIFAQNARSQEGKAQVELALLRYRLPRLRGRGRAFSQQAGGIGTRGPGETQLEVDRRRLLRRMTHLEAELRGIARTRTTQARSRRRGRQRTVSLVGYTNAGKSTLLNRLTDAGVVVEDRLFSTLDACTRRLDLPGGETVLVSDTVGFVRRLPHQLVEAFRSTLEVVREADLLVHVVDGSAPDHRDQIDAVRTVLDEIGAGDVPELLVLNKADRGRSPASSAASTPDVALSSSGPAVTVSALTGEGMDELLVAVGDRLRRRDRTVALMVPFDRGDVLAALHREGEVVEEAHGEGGTKVQVVLDEAGRARFREFVAS
jgi:GTP-binding protein HflX